MSWIKKRQQPWNSHVDRISQEALETLVKKVKEELGVLKHRKYFSFEMIFSKICQFPLIGMRISPVSSYMVTTDNLNKI